MRRSPLWAGLQPAVPPLGSLNENKSTSLNPLSTFQREVNDVGDPLFDPPLLVSVLSSVGGITFSSVVSLALLPFSELVLFLALGLDLGLANLALLSR